MNMKSIIGWVTLLLLWAVGTPLARAQEDFDPTNPPEPNVYYKVTVSSNPKGINVSGGGQFTEGSSTYIYATSSSGDYKFSHWTLNGEFYSTQRTFYYTVEPVNASFVAHYEEQYHEEEFDPVNPSEPTTPQVVVTRTLTLVENPTGRCSFNVDKTQKVKVHDWVYLSAYPETDYDFIGWYQKGQCISTSQYFYFQMPAENTTLTAIVKYNYNPANPSEPGNPGQGNVDMGHVGDANGDGIINIADAVHVVNVYLEGGSAAGHNRVCDMNEDGKVDVADAVIIVNTYLGNR